jgi:altronate dehydratase small subunit
MKKFIVITSKDNVATATVDIEAGTMVEVGRKKKIKLKQPIPLGHKFAVQKMEIGAHIIKYGEPMGRATQTIEEGELVHVHNVESMRGRGDLAK